MHERTGWTMFTVTGGSVCDRSSRQSSQCSQPIATAAVSVRTSQWARRTHVEITAVAKVAEGASLADVDQVAESSAGTDVSTRRLTRMYPFRTSH